ncbi:MAG: NAD-dependent epimerase/dehydratase family protein [Candidatus Nitrohelix vancouverensis]|uniref:GDP-L-fucose synthase n=1 Tax=Candidatus Nitrohelix vancouverensis TaxID=2705534 RepID=A0A7T0G3J7_9BACT|nr:MAG: NAD-dependent epimerase/dehydratase family protein [Candidatus Nitrohelix vancouverensis]
MNSFWPGKKVTVTGGAGFLGRHIVARLEKAGAEVFVPRRKDYDFVHPDACSRCFENHPADIVIHSAAYYGGLGITLAEPGKIFYENLVMGANLFEAARCAGVEKFVGIGTACSYPGYLEGDLREVDLWAGPLHETVVHYGLTKKMMAVQGVAYKQQYDFDSIHLILTNLYGPFDDFGPERSHAVPALVKRFVDACRNKSNELVCWGTGSAIREFLYVDDAAEAVLRATETYNDTLPLNIGTGVGTSIKELVERIQSITGFKGRIVWDDSKADGAARKVLDLNLMKSALGWTPSTDLQSGLEKTIAWYTDNS